MAGLLSVEHKSCPTSSAIWMPSKRCYSTLSGFNGRGSNMTAWTNSPRDKNSWLYDGATRVKRIRAYGQETYLCYADGKYLGRQPTLEAAQAACLEALGEDA